MVFSVTRAESLILIGTSTVITESVSAGVQLILWCCALSLQHIY